MARDLQLDDFHLGFESAGPDRWQVVARRESGGATVRAPLRWPVIEERLEKAWERVWAGRLPALRDVEAGGRTDGRLLQAIGEALFEAAFAGEARTCLSAAMEHARQRHRGLRIWLHTGGRPELERLPWEAMFDPRAGRFLAQSRSSPIVRFLEDPEPLKVTSPERPLRILLVTASPADRQPLGVTREVEAIAGACRERERAGEVVLERLPSATLEELRRRLDDTERPCHVVHFIGHSGRDAALEDQVLVLEDGGGGSRGVGARLLIPLLLDHDPLQLLVLNSCEGARVPPAGAAPCLAQALVRQRIPAVVAMQICVTDPAAIDFAGHFYSALAAGSAVDAALASCRKAMLARHEIGWVAPTLYLRGVPEPLLPAAPPLAPAGPWRWRRRTAALGAAALAAAALLAVLGGPWLAPGRREQHAALPRGADRSPEVALRSATAGRTAVPAPELPECLPAPELATMRFMRLGPGTFLMGSPHGGSTDERPAHYVTLSPFCMGSSEVTQAQWRNVMGEAASQGSAGTADLPVADVSWDDVEVFLARLNGRAGRQRYRLPTEAEWEYAARAGTATAYSFGDDPGELYRYGNCQSLEHDDGFDRLAPVGSFRSNHWGLYDLYGNVSEWVEDAYARYGSEPVQDPHVLAGELRVRRGGSWKIVAKNCRSAFRNKSRPSYRSGDVGFRLVRSPN